MPLRDTLLPLGLAPLGAVLVLILFGASMPLSGSYVAVAFLFGYAYGLAAAVVFVLPVLVLVPRLRRPPLWLAAAWGAATGLAAIALVLGAPQILRWEVAAGYGAAGAAAGLVYAASVRIPALSSTDESMTR